MKAFLSFAMSRGTWYACTFTFIYSDQEIQLTIQQQNYVQSCTWNFTQTTQQMQRVHTHIHSCH